MAKTKLLFVCIGNTCRSPMAAAIAQEQLGSSYDCISAGCTPDGKTISPLAKVAVEANKFGKIKTMNTRELDTNLLKWADKIYMLSEGAEKFIERNFPVYRNKCSWYTESGKVPDPLDLHNFPVSELNKGVKKASLSAYTYTASLMHKIFTPNLKGDLEYSSPSHLSFPTTSKQVGQIKS